MGLRVLSAVWANNGKQNSKVQIVKTNCIVNKKILNAPFTAHGKLNFMSVVSKNPTANRTKYTTKMEIHDSIHIPASIPESYE